MNTLENNKLIAEFLGFEYIDENSFLEKYDLEKDDTSHLMVDRVVEKYSTDWNLLMNLVERIEDLGHYVKQSKNITIIDVPGSSHKEFIAFVHGGSKIQSVYNACIDFIKWYNAQNS